MARPITLMSRALRQVETDMQLPQRFRRLPIIFLLDSAADMVGAKEMALIEGITYMLQELRQHHDVAEITYITTITATTGLTMLESLSDYNFERYPLTGTTQLSPLLTKVHEIMQLDLIDPSPYHPGDCNPIIVLILNHSPRDDWRELATQLSSLSHFRPFIIAFQSHRENMNDLKTLTPFIFTGVHEGAVYVHSFLQWATAAIVTICTTTQQQADLAITLPEVPSGIVTM